MEPFCFEHGLADRRADFPLHAAVSLRRVPGDVPYPPPGAGPSWSTASFGDAAGTSPMELSALGEHLELCRSLSGRLFGLRCAAENVQGFVAARFVTTLVVLSLIIGVGSLAW